jgi:hypothetical protein
MAHGESKLSWHRKCFQRVACGPKYALKRRSLGMIRKQDVVICTLDDQNGLSFGEGQICAQHLSSQGRNTYRSNSEAAKVPVRVADVAPEAKRIRWAASAYPDAPEAAVGLTVARHQGFRRGRRCNRRDRCATRKSEDILPACRP